MIRRLPLPIVGVLGLVAILNFVGIAHYIEDIIWVGHGPWDFPVYVQATEKLFDGTMYDWADGYIFPYSPVFAWLFWPIAQLGIIPWWGLHFACVALIPSWTWRIAILVSWGFWMDTFEGNVTVLFMLAGYWAVRGNRVGGWAFLLMSLLIPKPQFLAGMIWLLWKEPAYRKPFFLVLPVYAVAVLATGYGFEWLAALPGSSHDINNPYQFLPSRIIGVWWLAIGVPLGLWLIWKDRPGWAGIAMSLYAGAPQLLLLTMERDWSWLGLGREVALGDPEEGGADRGGRVARRGRPAVRTPLDLDGVRGR